MKKKVAFDAVVNANNAITIPDATRKIYGITTGTAVKVELVVVPESEYRKQVSAPRCQELNTVCAI